MKHYDVIILGAGTAGLAAQKQVARKTKNYLVIDPGPLGTTCTRVGCMPSKAFIEAAHIFAAQLHFSEIGAKGARAKLDSAIFMRHVRKLRDYYTDDVLRGMRKWQKSHFLCERARFVTATTVEAGGKIYAAKKIIVATGSYPIVPPNWGVTAKEILTTNSIFELKKLPRTMAIIGSGPIGLEIGQALAHLGVDVTIFGEAKSIGGLSDPRIVRDAVTHFQTQFCFLNQVVTQVEKKRSQFHLRTRSKTYSFENILVAIGRKPNLTTLTLPNIGKRLKTAPSGIPELTEDFCIPGTQIYFVGDVNHHRPLLHEAAHQAYMIAKGLSARDRVALAITFTSPNIALIGLSYQKLRKSKQKFITGVATFTDQGRAKLKMQNVGRLHVYVEPKSGKLLGSEIFCPEGEHLAHLLNWAMTAKQTVFDLLKNPFYHPTLEEGLRTALADAATNAR